MNVKHWVDHPSVGPTQSLHCVARGEPTGVVLPQALDADDVWLEAGLRGLHVHVVAHAVQAVLEAAILAVRALLPRLPGPPRGLLALLCFWRIHNRT